MRLFAAALLTVLIPAASLAQTTAPAGGDATAPAASAAAPAGAAAMPSDAPPAGSMKLSEIIAALEARVGDQLAYIDEASWDDDGYWEIEYKSADGSETEVKIDPATGEPRM